MLKTYQIDLDHAAIFNRCMAHITENSLQKTSDNAVISKKVLLGGYENYDRYTLGPHTWPELNNLLKLFSSPADGSWFNVMVQHSYIREHTHPRPRKYVCVYYPHSLPEHPPFEYFDSVTDTWQTIQCLTGDYMIFPKMLLHRVGTQISTVPRCSISINI